MSSIGRNESKAEKDRQKQIQDKCQTLLTQMLRDEDNKYCVDCDAKGPRWASWNLGIFLCIRCAGIHRNLGVHISKVKSVNLDSWTPEQVVSLQQMGNSRARAVYEASLPDSWRRPQTDSSLESFIRAKYQHQKYIAKEWVSTPLPKVDWDKELDEEAERQKKKKKEKQGAGVETQVGTVKRVLDAAVPALPKPSRLPKSKEENKHKEDGASVDLLSLNSPSGTHPFGASDEFSSFLSAPVPETQSAAQSAAQSSQTARSAEEESFFTQTSSQSEADKRQMSKESIMALYGQNNQFNPGLFGAGNFQQGIQAPMQNGVSPIPNLGMQNLSGFMPSGQTMGPNSNPFFNMNQNSQFQHGRNNMGVSEDLIGLDPSQVTVRDQPQLPQQMTGLSLNPGMGLGYPGLPAPAPPQNVTNPSHFLPQSQPSVNPGQTFTMHLWQ